ncbi:MAG: HD-GYP domain-containing protein [Pirellulales bacterium]
MASLTMTPPETRVRAATCTALQSAFGAAIGADFALAYQDIHWWRAEGRSGAHLTLLFPEGKHTNERLNEAARQARPVALPADPGCCLLCVSLSPLLGSEVALWGLVDTDDHILLQRFADNVWRDLQREYQHGHADSQIHDFARQVTSDFEELCWLRGLAEHLDLCGLQSTSHTVAQAILPELRVVVRAETILLLPPAAPDDTQADEGPQVLSVGTQHFTLGECWRMVAELAADAARQPAVWNSQTPEDLLCGLPGLRNCLLAKIGKQEHQLGWLLALNKVEPESDSDEPAVASLDLNETQFGTNEASLFNAAAVMLATHARNVSLFREKERLFVGVIRALINAIDAKDSYTCGHSDRVALVAKRIAEQMGVPPAECERYYLAGLLHDIGKIGVPDRVLQKPGSLTAEEFSHIKQHPQIGHSILSQVEQLADLLPGVLHHHESVDGRGYPSRLRGDEIPLLGRILAVADSYDAMTSSRPYRVAMPVAKAEAILLEGAGTQWDSQVVAAFFAALEDIHAICRLDDVVLNETAMAVE